MGVIKTELTYQVTQRSINELRNVNPSSEIFRSLPYQIGCPAWSWPDWRGSIYPARAAKNRWLHHYSTKFNSVEGNTTFYGIPAPNTVERWASESVEGFQFVLKFPRSISHEKTLVNAEMETEAFLEVLSILDTADRLGPTFLQLSPHFAPRDFELLENYLRQLPDQFAYALEVRHPDWFLPEIESELDSLLIDLTIDRVVFDSRPLFHSPATDDHEVQARVRKPRVPIRKQVTGRFPMLRLIGRNEVSKVDPWIEEWTEQVVQWIHRGVRPFVFMHTPDDTFAPEMVACFHQKLMQRLAGLSPLPAWEEPPAEQQHLF